MRHLESQLQRACITWLRLQYPKVIASAIPNGGYRNAREGAILKAEGVLAGMPDLFIAVPRGGYGGLFIEMKAGKGKPTATQVDMMDRLMDAGYVVEVIRTFNGFKDLVDQYMAQDAIAATGNDAVQLLST